MLVEHQWPLKRNNHWHIRDHEEWFFEHDASRDISDEALENSVSLTAL